MGYTHYFSNTPVTPEIVEDVRKILNTTDVKIGNGLGLVSPIVNEREIILNGWDASEDGGEDESYETFALPDGDFCKTGRLPYDEVVVAILTAYIVRGIGNIGSDGGYEDWEEGMALYEKATGIDPRAAVAEVIR